MVRYHRPPLMADENATLSLEVRDPDGSRTARRLRHEGRVPGVVYGGDADSVPFFKAADRMPMPSGFPRINTSPDRAELFRLIFCG